MSVKSISSVVNTSFIRSFQGLAGSDGPKIGAGAGQAASVYSGLRLGARTFATSIQNLNSAISVVNLADSALKKLSEVVDGMIGLTEKATSVSAGTETRRKLQSEFDDLVDEFRNVVAGSEIYDVEYLTEEGLATLFQRVGLDQETSEGVAAVLAQFIKPDTEDSFASEDTKASRPVNVPVLRKSKISQETNTALGASSGFGISADYSVYTDANGSGFTQPYHVDSTHTVSGQSGVMTNQTILAVNESKGNSGESTGYTVVTEGSPNDTVKLIAPDGSVVRTIASYTGRIGDIKADISADNKTAAVVSFGSANTATVEIFSVNNIGDAVPTVIDSPSYMNFGSAAEEIILSNDGSHYIYQDNSGATFFRHVATSDDTFFITNYGDIDVFGFASSDTVIFRDNDTSNIYSYTFGSEDPQLLFSDPNITNVTVLESDSTFSINDGSGSTHFAAIAYVTNNADGNELTVLNYDLNSGSLKTRYRRDLGQGTVEGISLAYQNDGNTSKDRIDVGVKGALPSLFGDQDTELYRINEAKFATNSSLFTAISSEPSKILDGKLYSRSDAYRMLADLKALKSQIGENLESIGEAREYIVNNIELARTAGYAFLDISNQLTGLEEAEQVAKMVAAEIRRNATRAQAAQVENLSAIVSQTTALLNS